MSQSYTGGNIDQTTSNASAYVTHGGTDLGLMGQDMTIGWGGEAIPRYFAQSKSPYAMVSGQGDAPYVQGIINEITQALLLKILHNSTSLDAGNSVGVNGDFGNVISDGVGWVYLLHNVSGLPKRVKYPKANLYHNGELPIGSAAEMLAQPFRMAAIKDNTASAGEQIYRVYYDEDEVEVTITPSPADGAVGQSTSVVITLTFSEAIGSDFAVTAASNPYIHLINASDGTTALTGVSWNAARTVATLTHAVLSAATTYLIVVSGELRSDKGRKVAGDGATAGTHLYVNFGTA